MSSNEPEKIERRSTWSKFKVPSFKKKDSDPKSESFTVNTSSKSPERKIQRHKSEFLGRKQTPVDEEVILTDSFNLESYRRKKSLESIIDTSPSSRTKELSHHDDLSPSSPPVSFLDIISTPNAAGADAAVCRTSFIAPKVTSPSTQSPETINLPTPPTKQIVPKSFSNSTLNVSVSAPSPAPSGLLTYLGSFDEGEHTSANAQGSGDGIDDDDNNLDRNSSHSGDSTPVEKFHSQSIIVSRSLQPSLSTVSASSTSSYETDVPTNSMHTSPRYDTEGDELKKRIDSLMTRFNSSNIRTGTIGSDGVSGGMGGNGHHAISRMRSMPVMSSAQASIPTSASATPHAADTSVFPKHSPKSNFLEAAVDSYAHASISSLNEDHTTDTEAPNEVIPPTTMSLSPTIPGTHLPTSHREMKGTSSASSSASSSAAVTPNPSANSSPFSSPTRSKHTDSSGRSSKAPLLTAQTSFQSDSTSKPSVQPSPIQSTPATRSSVKGGKSASGRIRLSVPSSESNTLTATSPSQTPLHHQKSSSQFDHNQFQEDQETQLVSSVVSRKAVNRPYRSPSSLAEDGNSLDLSPHGTSTAQRPSRFRSRRSLWYDVQLHSGCAFCGVLYDNIGWEAVTFTCGHSFCLSCNELAIQLYDLNSAAVISVLCPVCCQAVDIHLNISTLKASHLHRDSSRDNTDAASSLIGVSENVTVCENCEDNVANLWCEFCRINFCEKCDIEIHSSNAMKRHLRCAITMSRYENEATAQESTEHSETNGTFGDSNTEPTTKSKSRKMLHASRLPAVCDNHRLRILDKYCKNCMQAVCGECATSSGNVHEHHEVALLEEVAESFRAHMDTVVESAKKSLCEIRDVVERLDYCMLSLRVDVVATDELNGSNQEVVVNRSLDIALMAVESEYQLLEVSLRNRQDFLLQEVTRIRDDRIALLLEEKRHVQRLSDRVSSALNDALCFRLHSGESESPNGEIGSIVWNLQSVLTVENQRSDLHIFDDEIRIEFSRFVSHALQAYGVIVAEKDVIDFSKVQHDSSTQYAQQSSRSDSAQLSSQHVLAANMIAQTQHLQNELQARQSRINRAIAELGGGGEDIEFSRSGDTSGSEEKRNAARKSIGSSSGFVAPKRAGPGGAGSTGSANGGIGIRNNAVQRAQESIKIHFNELLQLMCKSKRELNPKLREYANVKMAYISSLRDNVVEMQSSMLFYTLQILHAIHSDNHLIASKYIMHESKEMSGPSGTYQLETDFRACCQESVYQPLLDTVTPHIPISFLMSPATLLCDHGSVGAPSAPVDVSAKLSYRGQGHSIEMTWSKSRQGDKIHDLKCFEVQRAVGRSLASTNVLTIDLYEIPFESVVECAADTFSATIDVQDYPSRIIQLRVRSISAASLTPSVWSEIFSVQTPDSFKRVFEFGSPFDHSGLLYWLGTNGHKSPYQNPHLSGAVTVTMSSSSTPLHMFVDNAVDRSYCMTTDRIHQWMCVDIGPNRLLHPTGYCLRTSKGDTWKPRNWDLQARADKNSKWVVLRRHRNCSVLSTTSYSVGAWKIETASPEDSVFYFSHSSASRGSSGTKANLSGGLSPAKECKERNQMAAMSSEEPNTKDASYSSEQHILTGSNRAYRYFRIFQTGVNSSSDNYLVCNGIELYGVLYSYQ